MINIAIDGPAGAGKSTISREIAHQIGYIYVDTGALYRAVGLYMLRSGIDPSDSVRVCSVLGDINVKLVIENGEQSVFLNGENVNGVIRTPAAAAAASAVSALPQVRAFLLGLQRDIASKNNCIMDGRDIGTVVLPDATLKIFLSASDEDRARRRYDELVLKDPSVTYEKVLADVRQRDFNDMNRETAPLRAADDAVRVDTSGNTFEQSVSQLRKIIETKVKGNG
jgi:cytidylate kinase